MDYVSKIVGDKVSFDVYYGFVTCWVYVKVKLESF